LTVTVPLFAVALGWLNLKSVAFSVRPALAPPPPLAAGVVLGELLDFELLL
jgi:hypothetical protein